MRLVRVCVHSARLCLLVGFRLCLLGGLLFGALIWASHQAPLGVPHRALAQVEARINGALSGAGLSVRMGAAAVGLRTNLAPALSLADLHIFDRSGVLLASLDRFEVVFSRDAALVAWPVPVSVQASGVRLVLTRAVDGRLTLRLGDAAVVRDALTPDDAIRRVRAVLARPELVGLRTIGMNDVAINLNDLRDGRRVMSRSGTLRITRGAAAVTEVADGNVPPVALTQDALRLEADLGVFDQDGAPSPGRVSVQVDSPGPQAPTALSLRLRGVEPARIHGIAGPGPLAAVLARMRAPVSLDLEGGIAADGRLLPLTGRLRVGAGEVVLPGLEDATPLETLSADLVLSPDRSHLAIRDMMLRSPVLAWQGDADLRRVAGDRIAAHLALRSVRAEVPRPYGAPIPFRADRIWGDVVRDRASGALTLVSVTAAHGGARIHATGRVDRAGPDGAARLALDLTTAALTPDALFALWPAPIAQGPRGWLHDRLGGAHFPQARLALRHVFDGAQDPARKGLDHVALALDFEGATVAVMDGIAPLTGAAGSAHVSGSAFAVVVTGADMPIAPGRTIALHHATADIARIGAGGAPLRIDLQAGGGIGDTMAFLRQPLFARGRPATDAAQPVLPADVTGRVRVQVDLRVPLGAARDRVPLWFAANGAITDVQTGFELAGQSVSAQTLGFAVSPDKFTLGGPVLVGGFPVDLEFSRKLQIGVAAPDPAHKGIVTADMAVTPALLTAWNAALPRGMLRGAAQARIRADLGSGAASAALSIVADLRGLGISVPAAGIFKPRARDGTLRIDATLGEAPALDSLDLRFAGTRLEARGDLRADGGLERLFIDRLALGRWLDVRGTLDAARALRLTGGSVDLRYLPDLPRGSGGARPRMGGIDVTLDRVRLAQTLALTDLRGRLSGDLNGSLTARVNGAAPVTLRLAPGDTASGRPAMHVTGPDGGEVLRSSGLVSLFQGGAFDLRLVPRGGKGRYRGQLRVRDTALVDGPGAAAFVAALSGIGAVDLLAGRGIAFSDVRADFMLTPDRIDLMSASATGPAIGLSIDGDVDLAGRRLDLQGVVSPVYFLNQIGSFMTRRGEGLFGLHYTLTGSMAGPRLAANPLSVLTPGFLREVFRGEHGQ